jgi:hypothetical protein
LLNKLLINSISSPRGTVQTLQNIGLPTRHLLYSDLNPDFATALIKNWCSQL